LRASMKEQQRFREEAVKLLRMNHERIVKVHEFGVQEGQPFFTMRLMERGSLRQHLSEFVPGKGSTRQDRRKRLETVGKELREVARAVQHMHDKGLLHLDLKPANLLLDDAGHLHVSDFGLARGCDKEKEAAHPTSRGTKRYMAPEHLMKEDEV